MARPLWLPNDVLLLIWEQLNTHADRWNLSLVSQRFHDLFIPLVYRTARLNNWRNVHSFLCAITNRPFLARAVRELDMSGWQRETISSETWDLLQQCPALQGRIEFSSDSSDQLAQWEKEFASGRAEPWTAMVLPLLTQLHQVNLVFSTSTSCLTPMMEKAIDGERPFQAGLAFQHLQNVVLDYQEVETAQENARDEASQNSSAVILPFLCFPSIRSIIANSVVDSNSDWEHSDVDAVRTKGWQPSHSSITEIDLRRSSGNDGMAHLIKSCTNLQSFKYQHSDAHLASHGYRPRAFYRSLAQSKATLQTLWLDHYGDHYPFTAAGLNQTHDEWFGSLADFLVLREIRIRLPNLLDIRYQNEPTSPLISCLPGSLETLYIEGCEERHVAMLVTQLRSVVKHCRSRFTHLRCLDIEGSFEITITNEVGDTSSTVPEISDHTIKPKILQAAEPLHEDCVSAGLELHIHDRAFIGRS